MRQKNDGWEDEESWQSLALAILDRAQKDAMKGDVTALIWLVAIGADVADKLTPGGGAAILSHARRTWQRIETGELRKKWVLTARG